MTHENCEPWGYVAPVVAANDVAALVRRATHLLNYPRRASEASEPWVVERIPVVCRLQTQRWLGRLGKKLGGMIEGMCKNVLERVRGWMTQGS